MPVCLFAAAVRRRPIRAGEQSVVGGVLLKLGCGACAGITAQTLTYPGDTVRRRLQVSPLPRSLTLPLTHATRPLTQLTRAAHLRRSLARAPRSRSSPSSPCIAQLPSLPLPALQLSTSIYDGRCCLLFFCPPRHDSCHRADEHGPERNAGSRVILVYLVCGCRSVGS